MKTGTYNGQGVFIDTEGKPAYSDFPVGTLLACSVRCSFTELYTLSVTLEGNKLFTVQKADYPGIIGYLRRRPIDGEKGHLVQMVASDSFISWAAGKNQLLHERLTQKRLLYVRPAAVAYTRVSIETVDSSTGRKPSKALLALAAASLIIPLN